MNFVPYVKEWILISICRDTVLVDFLILCIYKNQYNALITIQQKRSQNPLHIRCQLLYVSAPRCHHQGSINNKLLLVQQVIEAQFARTSSTKVKSLKTLKVYMTPQQYTIHTSEGQLEQLSQQQYKMHVMLRGHLGLTFSDSLTFVKEVRANSACSICWTYKHLLLIDTWWWHLGIYRVIHKSLRVFRTRLRNNQDRHGRKEHINR